MSTPGTDATLDLLLDAMPDRDGALGIFEDYGELALELTYEVDDYNDPYFDDYFDEPEPEDDFGEDYDQMIYNEIAYEAELKRLQKIDEEREVRLSIDYAEIETRLLTRSAQRDERLRLRRLRLKYKHGCWRESRTDHTRSFKGPQWSKRDSYGLQIQQGHRSRSFNDHHWQDLPDEWDPTLDVEEVLPMEQCFNEYLEAVKSGDIEDERVWECETLGCADWCRLQRRLLNHLTPDYYDWNSSSYEPEGPEDDNYYLDYDLDFY